jgi:peptide-methionine (S)-S-oxide reductase
VADKSKNLYLVLWRRLKQIAGMKIMKMTMLKLSLTVFVISLVQLISCAQPKKKDKMTTPLAEVKTETTYSGKTDTATFANGCFWCTEAIFEQLEGVISAVSGYTDGHVKNPTYKEVCTGNTGHAECLQIVYDPQKISFDELLEVFWETHDPTTLNRQGNDVGTQYRSGIYYHNEEQKQKAEKYKTDLNKSGAFDDPIVTEIKPFSVFYPAEDYHQQYFENNEGSNPYCTIVVRPKVDKFRKVFKDKLKK